MIFHALHSLGTLKALRNDRHCIRLLLTVGLGTAGFAMQDILLEPYGGENSSAFRRPDNRTNRAQCMRHTCWFCLFFASSRRRRQPTAARVYRHAYRHRHLLGAVVFASPLQKRQPLPPRRAFNRRGHRAVRGWNTDSSDEYWAGGNQRPTARRLRDSHLGCSWYRNCGKRVHSGFNRQRCNGRYTWAPL